MINARLGDYVLTRKLGAGGYGEVWCARHFRQAELQVAIKLVGPALAGDPQFVEALTRECVRLDGLDHTNIVRFRHLVMENDRVAMVLELLQGEDLQQRLRRGPLSVEVATPIIEAMLEGLGYAHSKGVMHRDVKPSNVFCCEDGRIKLLDFGIARSADNTGATKTGHMLGTMDYMAAERFEGESGRPASDIYAVGLVFWELLAGKPACPAGEPGRKIGWHLQQGLDATKVRVALPAAPGWVGGVIGAMSNREAADRPADGAAALALLRRERDRHVEGPARSGKRPLPEEVEGPEVKRARVEAERRAGEEAERARVEAERKVGEEAERARVEAARKVEEEAGRARVDTARKAGEDAQRKSAESAAKAAAEQRKGGEQRAATEARRLAEARSAEGAASAAAGQRAAAAAKQASGPPARKPQDSPAAAPPAKQGGGARIAVVVALAAIILLTVAFVVLSVLATIYNNPFDELAAAIAADFGVQPDPPPGPPAAAVEGTDWPSQSLGVMKWIPAGKFTMGSPNTDTDHAADEDEHSVTLAKGFWMMEHEVTQGEWVAVMGGENPASFTACGLDCPVERVSWGDAVAFAKASSARDGVTYRLPTESEWERAARGGHQGELYAGGNELDAVAWMSGNANGTTHRVCTAKSPRNAYGLCDMTGNVWEWVQDSYNFDYAAAPTDGSAWEGGASRVYRGGGWHDPPWYARVAKRDWNDPVFRFDSLGFRLSRSIP